MGIRITAVHLDGGYEHEHIAEVEWENLEWGNVGESSVGAVIRWLDEPGNVAVVGSSEVAVMRSPTGSVWLQAIADGTFPPRAPSGASLRRIAVRHVRSAPSPDITE